MSHLAARMRSLLLVAICLLAARAPLIGFPAAVLLLAWLPGCFLWRCLGVRVNDRGTRLVAAVALSIAVAPVPLDLIWRWVHDPATMLAVWSGALGLLAVVAPPPALHRSDRGRLFENRRSALVCAGVLTWLVAAIVFAHWPAEWRGGALPASPRDYIKHHAVLFSLERAPLPLGSIYFADPSAGPYYYYHFFYLLPATARLIAGTAVGIEAAYAVFAAVVAATVLGLVYVLTRLLTGRRGAALFAVICAALVGGFDLLPATYHMLKHQAPVIVLDAWAPVEWRAHNFANLMLWAPQHMLGLVIFATAVWLLSARPQARWWLLLGPLLGASLFGTSVYFAMTVFPAVAAWVVLQFVRAEREHRWRWLAGAAAVAAIGLAVMAFQGLHYLEMSRRHEGGLTAAWDRYTFALLGRLLPPGALANLIDLPWILLLEYGVRFVAIILVPAALFTRLWRDPGGALLLISSVLGAVLFVTFHSGIHPYDYSFKIGLLPSMLLTVMLTGALVRSEGATRRWWNPLGWTPTHIRFPHRRRAVGVLIGVAVLIGLPVGLVEVPMTALRRFVLPNPLGADSAAIRFAREELPADAVVQVYPHRSEGRSRMTAVPLMNRQIGVMSPDDAEVNVFRPRGVERMRAAARLVEQAGATDSARRAAALLRRLGVTHVLVGTIERRRWRRLEKFGDPRYFERLFDSPGAAVVAVPATNRDRAPLHGDAAESRQPAMGTATGAGPHPALERLREPR